MSVKEPLPLNKCETLDQFNVFLASADITKQEGLFHTGRKVVVNDQKVTLNQVIQKFEEILETPDLNKSHVAYALARIKTLEQTLSNNNSFAAWQIGSHVVSWIGQRIFNREKHLTAITSSLSPCYETLNQHFTLEETATPQQLLNAFHTKSNKADLIQAVATYLADAENVHLQGKESLINTLTILLNENSPTPLTWPSSYHLWNATETTIDFLRPLMRQI